MRITILVTAALSIISITQASYILNIPMERGQGGALSDGSIKFTTRTPPIPVEPLLGEWVDKGLPINCSAWTPLPETVKKDQPFEQSSTCSQEQTRTVEEQVKNLDTGVISKTGNKSEESQTISVVKKQSTIGTKTYDETPYNLTDINWINGVGREFSGFFLENNQWNVDRYHVGDSIKFIDGQTREITRIELYPAYMEIYLNGTPLDGNIVGYPNKIILQ